MADKQVAYPAEVPSFDINSIDIYIIPLPVISAVLELCEAKPVLGSVLVGPISSLFLSGTISIAT